MPMATVGVSYRPTWRQAVGRAMFDAILTAVGAAIGVALVLLVVGTPTRDAFLTVPVMAAVVFVAVVALARRQGVVATETGLVRVTGNGTAPPRREVPWRSVVDIRAERRGSRTVVRLYLDSGGSWRCGAPYDGMLLARDPEFEQKFFTLRNIWETYRSWSRPSGDTAP